MKPELIIAMQTVISKQDEARNNVLKPVRWPHLRSKRRTHGQHGKLSDIEASIQRCLETTDCPSVKARIIRTDWRSCLSNPARQPHPLNPEAEHSKRIASRELADEFFHRSDFNTCL